MENKQVNDDFVEIAKSFLQMVSGELDPYTSKKGTIEVSGNAVTLFTPDYIQFAKYGRGAGKKPPLSQILEFVKKNNIRFENQTERGTAFAIQASIAKNGTLNYKPNAPNALNEAIEKHITEFNEKIGNIIKVSIQKDVNAIYSNTDPFREIKI